MRAWDISIPAFYLGDEPLGYQKVKRSVDGGRLDWARHSARGGFNQFVSTCRAAVFPEQFQYLMSHLCKVDPAIVAEVNCHRNPFSRRILIVAMFIIAG